MKFSDGNIAACPRCRDRYQVPDTFRGRKIACKKCGVTFTLVLQKPEKSGEKTVAPFGDTSEVERISCDDSYLTIGKLAVKYKFATVEQVKTALSIKERRKKTGNRIFLGEILVENKTITESQLDFLHSVQKLIEARQTDAKFGMLAVKNEFATREEIDMALVEQKRRFKQTKTLKPIGEILVEKGVMSLEQLEAVLIRQRRLKMETSEEKAAPANVSDEKSILNAAELALRVAEDRLSAFVCTKNGGCRRVAVQDIKALADRGGIKYGLVDEARLRELLEKGLVPMAPLKIAEGKPAVPGDRARIKYFFEPDPFMVETAKNGGAVDFKDRGMVRAVKKQDLLAQRIPGTEGISGKDVFGGAIQPPKTRDIKLSHGKGTYISEDGSKIFAAMDGVPSLSVHGKVSVSAVLDIEGDVGLKTGHVDFDGRIDVNGGVQSGFQVSGDSLCAKEILKAEVDMTGDVAVSGGIIGASVRSGGNVRSIYVRESQIEAFGDVVVEKEIIDSKIQTSGACIIKGGAVLSSVIAAKKGIWASQVGSDVSKPCSLMLGADLPSQNKMLRMSSLLPLRVKSLDETRALCEKLDAQSKRIESKIGELAQEQDRAMIEMRNHEVRLSEVQKTGDGEVVQEIQARRHKLDAQVKKREENLEKLFDLQDQMTTQTTAARQRVEALEKEIEYLEEKMAEVTEYTKNSRVVPEVRVGDTIFPDTRIKGLFTSLTLPRASQNVLIKECKFENSNETQEWSLKVLPLE